VLQAGQQSPVGGDGLLEVVDLLSGGHGSLRREMVRQDGCQDGCIISPLMVRNSI
jgi:hypothetical protein